MCSQCLCRIQLLLMTALLRSLLPHALVLSRSRPRCPMSPVSVRNKAGNGRMKLLLVTTVSQELPRRSHLSLIWTTQVQACTLHCTYHNACVLGLHSCCCIPQLVRHNVVCSVPTFHFPSGRSSTATRCPCCWGRAPHTRIGALYRNLAAGTLSVHTCVCV